MAIQILRPNTVAIFATDPSGAAGVAAKLSAFLLTQTTVDIPGRVRMDTVGQISHTEGHDIPRSPIERAVTNGFVKRPEVLTVSGTLSATPLFAFGGGIGTFGSLIRRDLIQLKALKRLSQLGEPVVVVTPFDVFGSMGIDNINDVHSLDHKVDLTLNFSEVEIVSPLTTNLDLDAFLAGGAAEAANGGQSTGAVADPTAAGGLL